MKRRRIRSDETMKRILVTVAVMLFAVSARAAGPSVATPPDEPEYTKAQIKKMVREAHTVEQFTVLANYYWSQQRMYKQKAVEQMHLWRERAETVTPLSEKYPRPVDSARNLHDYYEYRAAQSAALFAKYDRLADAAATK